MHDKLLIEPQAGPGWCGMVQTGPCRFRLVRAGRESVGRSEMVEMDEMREGAMRDGQWAMIAVEVEVKEAE